MATVSLGFMDQNSNFERSAVFLCFVSGMASSSNRPCGLTGLWASFCLLFWLSLSAGLGSFLLSDSRLLELDWFSIEIISLPSPRESSNKSSSFLEDRFRIPGVSTESLSKGLLSCLETRCLKFAIMWLATFSATFILKSLSVSWSLPVSGAFTDSGKDSMRPEFFRLTGLLIGSSSLKSGMCSSLISGLKASAALRPFASTASEDLPGCSLFFEVDDSGPFEGFEDFAPSPISELARLSRSVCLSRSSVLALLSTLMSSPRLERLSSGSPTRDFGPRPVGSLDFSTRGAALRSRFVKEP